MLVEGADFGLGAGVGEEDGAVGGWRGGFCLAGKAKRLRAGLAGGVFVAGESGAAGGGGLVVDLDGFHACSCGWVLGLGLKGKGCRAGTYPSEQSSLGTPRLRQPWKSVYISILRNGGKLIPPDFSAEFWVWFVGDGLDFHFCRGLTGFRTVGRLAAVHREAVQELTRS